VKSREKIFHGIAESFNADAKTMVTGFRTVAQDQAVELARLLPALQREMLENQTTRLHTAGSCGQMVDPIAPLLLIKFMQGERRRIFKARLFSRGKRNQLARAGIVLGRESYHPLLQNLRIAQLAQSAEQWFPSPAHSLPARVGIDEPHAVGQGATPPQRYPKIVDGVRSKIAGRVLALLEHALHPVPNAKLPLLWRDRRRVAQSQKVHDYLSLSLC